VSTPSHPNFYCFINDNAIQHVSPVE
jgi:hypothetical protein